MADRQHTVSRRDLLQASAAAATLTIIPRHVLGGQGRPSANERLNIAKYPKAKIYKDFRAMFDRQKDIDAVIVATPDHTHAVVALAAIRRGKHVYVQKPLAHNIDEARVLTEEARKYKVMSQMGNQGHSGDGPRLICEWMADGAIGAVREVHCWTNRPVWPQSIEVERPKETPPLPPTLDWDLWLGPAPLRPYHPSYHPGTWRAWWDFGTGSLGDLGCHIMDPAFWALRLKYPVSVEGCISTYWQDLPEVKLTWWDGEKMEVTNDKDANAYVRRPYRSGWAL